MNQSVALAAAWMLQERRREDAFAARREGHLHRVIHTAGHNRLDARAVWAAAKDVRGPRHERLLARPFVRLLRERSLAPVDPAVWPKVRAVEVVAAAGERLALEPFDALVGHAVAFAVGQLPDTRRGGDVERPRVPHDALGEHHLV